MTWDITLNPLLNEYTILILLCLGLLLVISALAVKASGAVLRLSFLILLIAVMLNPNAIDEQRQIKPDVVLVIVDRTASQNVGNRREETTSALQEIKTKLEKFKDLEIRVVEVFDGSAGEDIRRNKNEGTNLFTALKSSFAEIPVGRFAGAILITDGQVHDQKIIDKEFLFDGPVHIFLTGKKRERDRLLVIDEAPSYGLVGDDVSISFHVEEFNFKKGLSGYGRQATVTLKDDEKVIRKVQTEIWAKNKVIFKLTRPGKTIFTLEVNEVSEEVSTLNNQAFININGIRDRLRVLLVSGQPHAGERTWRNFLKSDLSVDLVHFTILRPPGKENLVPLAELALIAFPVRELFEKKIKDFDLIIFDRYLIRDILPPSYLQNVVDYVFAGGAVMLSVGPEYSGPRSLYNSPLGKILLARPTGGVFERGFRAELTESGFRHPVTAGLAYFKRKKIRPGIQPTWGRWFRQIETRVLSGETLMTGVLGSPLLMVDRKGQGRVAMLLSDHIWLWARGYEGGGPQSELLRRTAHWLMKEPELEENSLRAEIKLGELIISYSSLEKNNVNVEIVSPSGKTKTQNLIYKNIGSNKLVVPATEVGLYKVKVGAKSILVHSGSLNSRELRDLTATDKKVAAIAEKSGGSIFWMTEKLPDFRRVRSGRNYQGDKWAGILENRSYNIVGSKQVRLLTGFIFSILMTCFLAFIWWRESK